MREAGVRSQEAGGTEPICHRAMTQAAAESLRGYLRRLSPQTRAKLLLEIEHLQLNADPSFSANPVSAVHETELVSIIVLQHPCQRENAMFAAPSSALCLRSSPPRGAGRRAALRTACCTAWALATIVLCAPPAWAADPDVLWKIVHGKCVPDQLRHHRPAPCAKVDLAGGVARGNVVLKDLRGATQFLVIPTARVTGIESPALLARGAPNYWAPAWQARRYVFARAHRALPRDAIGLAVNSEKGRSQNQLHIHIDCVRPDVRRSLREHAAGLSPRWSRVPLRFDGHRYWAMRVGGADLHGVDPFRALARGMTGARADMGDWTLVVVGVAPRGFVLLAGHVDPATNDDGSGEDLLDHDCALARSLPR